MRSNLLTLFFVTGSNFTTDVSVTIFSLECENVTVVSPNEIIATIPQTDAINPSQVLQEQATVIITAGRGTRSTIAQSSFLVSLTLNDDFVGKTTNWMTVNWLVPMLLGITIVLSLVTCFWCLCGNKTRHLVI
jgi:hypothetical protein